MCCMFVYLHFMDGLHVLLLTLKLSLRFVPANHRQLSLPSSALKRLLCTKQLLAKSRTAVNKLTSDWSWAHLNMGPALWLEVGPLWKRRGILQDKILPGGSPCILYQIWNSTLPPIVFYSTTHNTILYSTWCSSYCLEFSTLLPTIIYSTKHGPVDYST
jgi:hypothetical protein